MDRRPSVGGGASEGDPLLRLGGSRTHGDQRSGEGLIPAEAGAAETRIVPSRQDEARARPLMYDLTLSPTKDGDKTFHAGQITVGGESYPVDDRFGSWRVHVNGEVRDLIPPVAADLQAEVAPKRRAR